MSPAAAREPPLLYTAAGQNNLDGNTVDMDRERAAFADNSVKYEATLRFINGSVRTMLDAITRPMRLRQDRMSCSRSSTSPAAPSARRANA